MNSEAATNLCKVKICQEKGLSSSLILMVNIVVAIALNASVVQAANGIALRDYLGFNNEVSEINSYLGGVGYGYFYANIYAEMTGAKKIYCQPKYIMLDADNYIKILNDEIAHRKRNSQDTIEFIMLLGLRRAFPCP